MYSQCVAWIQYIDPQESGAVIPVVHVNGFKISERTIYGCMDDKEIVSLFAGYGYQVRFVENLNDIDGDLSASLDWALQEIRMIQKAARSGKPVDEDPQSKYATPEVRSWWLNDCFRGGVAQRKFTANSSKARFTRTKFHYRQQRVTLRSSRICKNDLRPTNPKNFSQRMAMPSIRSSASSPRMIPRNSVRAARRMTPTSH